MAIAPLASVLSRVLVYRAKGVKEEAICEVLYISLKGRFG